MCCDGLTGLPEAVEATWPDSMVPTCVVHLIRATRAVRRLRGPQGGRRRRAPEPAPPPTRRPPDGPWTPSASPTRAREHPQTAAGVGEGLGEVHPLPGLPPGPAPGHLCTTNAIESLNHRAARSAENRGHFPSDEAAARTAVASGSATSRTAGPRSAPRRRTRPPTRAGPTGGLVEGQVTTNRSAPPAGPPGSPPPTPTESTPISDRTRLHRNIDRLRMRAPESDRRRAGQDGAHHRVRQGEPGPRSARCAAGSRRRPPGPALGGRLRAPRGAVRSGGDERASGPACRGGPVEAGGSPIPGTGVRAGSGPDNDGTHQILPDGAGPASETQRHTRRNQWLKAPQADSHQPGTWRMGVGSHRAPGRRGTGSRSDSWVGGCRRPGGA